MTESLSLRNSPLRLGPRPGASRLDERLSAVTSEIGVWLGGRYRNDQELAAQAQVDHLLSIINTDGEVMVDGELSISQAEYRQWLPRAGGVLARIYCKGSAAAAQCRGYSNVMMMNSLCRTARAAPQRSARQVPQRKM